MLYYAAMTTPTGERIQGIYSAVELAAATWNPDTAINYITKLTAKSKAEARDLAIDIYNAERDTVDNGGEGLSYMEWGVIGDALERLARRFGLITEFKENGII